jgi:transposase
VLLYDVTSTYFEGQADANPQAQRGYSRDHRPDCKQVLIALVVTFDGFPLGYEVFAGNTHDSRTLQTIVATMEARHGILGRVWIVWPAPPTWRGCAKPAGATSSARRSQN